MKLRHSWIFGMACVLLSATVFSAQSTTATIQGLVSDEQKALCPRGDFTARNLETKRDSFGCIQRRRPVPNRELASWNL